MQKVIFIIITFLNSGNVVDLLNYLSKNVILFLKFSIHVILLRSMFTKRMD